MTNIPLVAPAGTGAVIDVGLQLTTYGALTPLKLTDPLLPPKLEPLMVISEPTAPELGDMSANRRKHVNKAPLLDTPLAVLTTTLPVAARLGTTAVILPSLQELMVAGLPPKVTLPST